MYGIFKYNYLIFYYVQKRDKKTGKKCSYDKKNKMKEIY